VAAAGSRVGRHAAITFAGLMAANVLGYIFYALVSRALGVDAYGTFSSLVAIVLIVASPATIGQMVIAKLATDFVGRPALLSGLVRTVDRVTLVFAAAVAATLAALSVPIATFLHLSDPLLVALAALSLCGAIVLPFTRGVLQGTSAFGAFALSAVAEALAKALFAPLLGAAAGLRGALSGMALAYGVAAVYTFVAARPHGRGAAVPLPLQTVLRTSAAVALTVFCINLLLFYDVVLARRYLDPHTAGLYGAASLAGRALFAAIGFVPIVLLPQTAGRSARGERTRVLFLAALGAAALLALVAIAFFAAFPRFTITTIAGRSFAEAAPYVVTYVYAIAMLSLANVIATYNIARGRMRFVVPLACVALAEIVVVVLRHRTATDLLQTIAVGHTVALLACTLSLGRSRLGESQSR
jgi:O-antigen/teichoic acid export membrane protein